ncbi:MAG: hypothetical protein NKF39_03415 [Tropheryma whipplei]|nr:hypothetical protein [Tropheryma whipplei]
MRGKLITLFVLSPTFFLASSPQTQAYSPAVHSFGTHSFDVSAVGSFASAAAKGKSEDSCSSSSSSSSESSGFWKKIGTWFTGLWSGITSGFTTAWQCVKTNATSHPYLFAITVITVPTAVLIDILL